MKRVGEKPSKDGAGDGSYPETGISPFRLLFSKYQTRPTGWGTRQSLPVRVK